MDILYVIGRGSRHENIELRMSLRSISKYALNIGKVVVAGCPPNWLSSAVEKVCVKDKYNHKHSNILNCIETVIDKGLVNGEFLYSSDDHFYVKPVDFNCYPYYFKAPLRDYVNRTDPCYEYHRSLYDTRKLLTLHSLPTVNYAQHCNTHMHTAVFNACREIVYESYKLQYGVEPTSLLMNVWQTMPDAPKTVHRDDLKISSAKSIQDIYEQIGDRECFSIGDAVFRTKAIRDFFNAEYSQPSPYEKT